MDMLRYYYSIFRDAVKSPSKNTAVIAVTEIVAFDPKSDSELIIEDPTLIELFSLYIGGNFEVAADINEILKVDDTWLLYINYTYSKDSYMICIKNPRSLRSHNYKVFQKLESVQAVFDGYEFSVTEYFSKFQGPHCDFHSDITKVTPREMMSLYLGNTQLKAVKILYPGNIVREYVADEPF